MLPGSANPCIYPLKAIKALPQILLELVGSDMTPTMSPYITANKALMKTLNSSLIHSFFPQGIPHWSSAALGWGSCSVAAERVPVSAQRGHSDNHNCHHQSSSSRFGCPQNPRIAGRKLWRSSSPRQGHPLVQVTQEHTHVGLRCLQRGTFQTHRGKLFHGSAPSMERSSSLCLDKTPCVAVYGHCPLSWSLHHPLITFGDICMDDEIPLSPAMIPHTEKQAFSSQKLQEEDPCDDRGRTLVGASGGEGGSDPVPQQFLHLELPDGPGARAEPAEPPWLRVHSPKSKPSCKSFSRETMEPLMLQEGSSSFQRSLAFPALGAAQLHSRLSCSHIPAPLEHLFSPH